MGETLPLSTSSYVKEKSNPLLTMSLTDGGNAGSSYLLHMGMPNKIPD